MLEDDSTINIKNKWYDLQEEESQFRIANADKILGDDIKSKIMLANKMSEEERKKSSFIAGLRLDEYQRLLNPEGQDKMMTLWEFCDNNPNIPNKFIFKTLVSLKYVHKYNFTLSGERVHWFAQQKPYTYKSIIPVYYPESNNMVLDCNIGISNEKVKILKAECKQEFEKFKEEQAKKTFELRHRKIEEEKKTNHLF